MPRLYLLKRQGIFLLLISFGVFLNQPAAFAVKTDTARNRLQNKVQAYDSQLFQSIQVTRISDGKALFSHNAGKLLSPASITKLFTTAAVLDGFPVGHHFKTGVLHSGKRSKGVIFGNLYLKGDGDPYLVSEKIWQMAVDLRNLGITNIRGSLILDGTLFKGSGRDDSRMEGVASSKFAYDAPVTAVGVNFNTLEVSIAPGFGVGRKPRVAVSPYPLRNVLIENAMKTVSSGSRRYIDVERRKTNQNHTKLAANGRVPLGSKLKKVFRSVDDPVLTSGQIIKAFLEKEGIAVNGGVKAGKVPRSAKKLYEIPSYPMGYVLRGLNTYSNNFVADVLVKRLGAKYPKYGVSETEGTGTYKNGLSRIRTFLRSKVGIRSEFEIYNGSGLSELNRFSSSQVTQLLQYVSRRLELFPDFVASLPVSGRNGTLEKRFNAAHTSYLRGRVRAKTGTLTSPKLAIGLAGFFEHPKHGLCGFSIIHNSKNSRKRMSVTEVRNYQDSLVGDFYQKL